MALDLNLKSLISQIELKQIHTLSVLVGFLLLFFYQIISIVDDSSSSKTPLYQYLCLIHFEVYTVLPLRFLLFFFCSYPGKPQTFSVGGVFQIE